MPIVMSYTKRVLVVLITLVLIFADSFALAEEGRPNLWHQDALTGNWGGLRTKMADKGVSLEFVYTSDVLSNVSGGIQTGTDYLDNWDLGLMVDLEKLVNWKGATFSAQGNGHWGGSPSANAGDAQALSNIDSANFWELYQLYLEQNFFDDKVSILVGLYDINSEFDSIQTAALFINSSQGMGADFSQSGQNGPSVWPYTALAARVRLMPFEDKFYFQTAVFDGVPGDPNSATSNAIKFNSGDGALIATEIGYGSGECDEENPDRRYYKIVVGNWIYTSKFDDVLDVDGAGNPLRHFGNYGFYGYGEYQLYREKQDPTQGLTVYARIGFANDDFNQFGFYTGGGAVYTGLIPGRDEDQLGVSVAAVHNGSKFKTAQSNAGTPVKLSEVAIETTYRAQLTPWLAIQPDLQYIINPGATPGVGNALVVGSRFEISF